MRVLVVGASGFIGGVLQEIFRTDHQVSGTFRSRPRQGLLHLDLTDPAETRAVLEQVRPELILHPAAVPNVEYCEVQPEETWAINVGGTVNLVVGARAAGAGLVFFSTDYLFDGRDGPYSEDTAPHPLNAYGRQKLACEEVIRSGLGGDHLIIRTTVVYGWEEARKNFVAKLLHSLRAGQPFRVPVDQLGNPTYVHNLAAAVKELVEGGQRGTFNVVGPETMGRWDFACIAARVFGLDERLAVPVTTAELGQVAPRPLRGGLRVEKVRAVLKTRLLGAEEGLGAMRAEEGTGSPSGVGTGG